MTTDVRVAADGSRVYPGDCLEVLKTLEDASVDLIVTSPPYADQRKNTYGGIHADQYVEWFLHWAKERNDAFHRECAKMSDTLVKNFVSEFCSDGQIHWRSIVEYSSKSGAATFRGHGDQ